jgi:hypothetical protein
MASPQWHDQLREELARQGLPIAYIARLIEELSDHVADVASEDSSGDVDVNSRLGTPQRLAVVAKTEYQRRTFAGRHRLVTFTAGPILAMIATIQAIGLTGVGLTELLDTALAGRVAAYDEVGSAAVHAATLHVFHSLGRFLPFALSALLFVRLGRHAELPLWSAGACGLIASTAIFFFSIHMPAKSFPAETRWAVGLGWGTGLGGEIGLGRILQAAAPFALAAWVIWRHSMHSQRPVVQG